MNFNIQPPPSFVFLVFHKNCLIKNCSSFEDLSAYKMSWFHVDWCKFSIRQRNLNVHHVAMIEATGLKRMRSGHPQWHDLAIEFHKNVLTDSTVTGGTHRQTMVISYTLFFFLRNLAKTDILM
jgi:hypothetical protein